MRGTGLGEKGFTLIELIVIIVILGILSAVAIPKFADLRGEAARGVAEGALGASRSFAAMNFARNLIAATPALLSKTTAGESLLLANLETDGGEAWTVIAGAVAGVESPISGTTYQIIINTAETTTAPAKLILQ